MGAVAVECDNEADGELRQQHAGTAQGVPACIGGRTCKGALHGGKDGSSNVKVPSHECTRVLTDHHGLLGCTAPSHSGAAARNSG
jgi:hypothetical protein